MPIASLAKCTEGGSGDPRLIVTCMTEEVVAGVPTVAKLEHPELAEFPINRAVGSPPGPSPDLVAKPEEGFRAAIESAAVSDGANAAGLQLDFKSAAATKAMMDDFCSFYSQCKQPPTN